MGSKKGLAYHLQILLVLTSIIIIVSFVSAEIITYSRGTLQKHPEWTSGKLLLDNPPMSAASATATRNLLKQNRLNLQEWHGSNEILFSEPCRPGTLRLQTYLGENACISLIYNKNMSSFSGVRLSRNPRYQNMFFTADADGRFLTKHPIKDFTVSDTWHDVELQFNQNSVELIIDGVFIQRVQEPLLEKQLVGFRSNGPFTTLVDNVEIINHKGETIISENFRNDHNFWRIAVSLFAAFMLLLLFVFVIALKAGVPVKTVANFTGCTTLCIAALVSLYFCCDYFLYSNLYPYKNCPFWKATQYHLNLVENIRVRFFDLFDWLDADDLIPAAGFGTAHASGFLQPQRTDIKNADFLEMQIIWSDPQGENIRVAAMEDFLALLDTMQPSSFYKIIFLGTSQTWGEGARSRKSTKVFQVHRILQNKAGDNLSYLTLNAGLKAADSSAMLKIMKKVAAPMQPELVIVNLSNNDPDPAVFKKNILDIYSEAIRHKANFVLIQEANSPDYHNIQLQKNHAVLRDIALGANLLCIDLHSYLSSPGVIDSGFLWWDSVHLTAYGQKKAAEYIAEKLYPLCNSSTVLSAQHP